MDKKQEIIDKAAAIMEQVAEPTFQHTNQAGALFVEAKKLIFEAAGVSGFTKDQQVEPTEEIEG